MQKSNHSSSIKSPMIQRAKLHVDGFAALFAKLEQTKQQTKTDWVSFWKAKGLDVLKCPHCQSGRLVFFGELVPIRGPPPTIQKPPQNQPSVSLT